MVQCRQGLVRQIGWSIASILSRSWDEGGGSICGYALWPSRRVDSEVTHTPAWTRGHCQHVIQETTKLETHLGHSCSICFRGRPRFPVFSGSPFHTTLSSTDITGRTFLQVIHVGRSFPSTPLGPSCGFFASASDASASVGTMGRRLSDRPSNSGSSFPFPLRSPTSAVDVRAEAGPLPLRSCIGVVRRDAAEVASPRARRREEERRVGPSTVDPLSEVRGGVSSWRTAEAERELVARALSLPLSVLMLVQTPSMSDIVRAFRERVDIINAGVVLRGVDAAEAEQLSSGNVSVSGVRIPVRFEGPAR